MPEPKTKPATVRYEGTIGCPKCHGLGVLYDPDEQRLWVCPCATRIEEPARG